MRGRSDQVARPRRSIAVDRHRRAPATGEAGLGLPAWDCRLGIAGLGLTPGTVLASRIFDGSARANK
jgi:hypothetical protein